MPLSYEKNKKHILKWRLANIDKFREINKKSKRKRDAWKRIQKEFFQILLS